MKHHLKNGRFRNNAELDLTYSKLWNVAKWKFAAPKVERSTLPCVQRDPRILRGDGDDQLITWIGHATFLLQYRGLNIITDPHFSRRASPSQAFGPKRTTPPALSLEQLPAIHVVVISHDHYDHLDEASVLALWRRQPELRPLFIVPLGLGRWLSKRGIGNWLELDWWQSETRFGVEFSAVPVQHFSGRGLRPNNTLWAGWVMAFDRAEGGAYQVFFAGDTGYSADFVEIGKHFGGMDLSLLPIGAYAPRWFMREVHVNPEEAVQIHLDVGSKRSLAMHWGSFVLTDEPMLEPPRRLAQALAERGLPAEQFVVPQHGETIDL